MTEGQWGGGGGDGRQRRAEEGRQMKGNLSSERKGVAVREKQNVGQGLYREMLLGFQGHPFDEKKFHSLHCSHV